MKLEEIKTAEPFKSLFPIEGEVLDRIQADMREHGYDPSQPVVLWSEKGIVIDGHSRLQAAQELGLEEVQVHKKSFPDEAAALEYAVHNQRDRRNLTQAQLFKMIEIVDEICVRGEG
jgi:ParB-like chromosome segregation protein Spo0J